MNENTETEIKCVIGGYTFILQLTQDDLTVLAGGASSSLTCTTQNSSRYLVISTMPQKLDEFITPSGIELSHSTIMLASRYSNKIDTLDLSITDASDAEVIDNDGDKFIFTGLTIEDDTPNTANTYYLAVNKLDDSNNIVWLNEAQRLSTVLTTSTGDHSIQTIDINDPSTDIVEANVQKASGKQAIAFGYRSTASGAYAATFGQNTRATAVNSVVSGNSAIASGDNSVATGNHTTASGANSVSAGNYTTASKANSVALGHYTTACSENQVVLGKYNEYDSSSAFIIGNGTSDSQRSNILTVASTGEMNLVNGTTGNNKVTIGGEGRGTGELHVGANTFDIDQWGNVDFRGSLKIGTKGSEELQFITDEENAKKLTLNSSLTQTGDFIIQTTQNDIRAKIASNTGTLELNGSDAELLVNKGSRTNYLKVTRDQKIVTDKQTTINNNLNANNIEAAGSLSAQGNLCVTGTSTFTDATTVNNDFTATGNVTLNGGTSINGNTNITGDLILKQENSTITAQLTSTKIDLNHDTNITGKLTVTNVTEFGEKVTAKNGVDITNGDTTLHSLVSVKNSNNQDILTIDPNDTKPRLSLAADCDITGTTNISNNLHIDGIIYASANQAYISSTKSKLSNIELNSTNQALYSSPIANLKKNGIGYYISKDSIALCPAESTKLILDSETASLESNTTIKLSKTQIGSIVLDPYRKISPTSKTAVNSIYGVEYAELDSIYARDDAYIGELNVADQVFIDSYSLSSQVSVTIGNSSNSYKGITLDTDGTVTARTITASTITADSITANNGLSAKSLSVSNDVTLNNLTVSKQLKAGSNLLSYCERISFSGISGNDNSMLRHVFKSDTSGSQLFKSLGLATTYQHAILEGSIYLTLASTDSKTIGGRYTGFEQTAISIPIAIHVNAYTNGDYEVAPAVIDINGAYGQTDNNYSLVIVYGDNRTQSGAYKTYKTSSSTTNAIINGFRISDKNYLNVYDRSVSTYLFAYIKKGGNN